MFCRNSSFQAVCDTPIARITGGVSSLYNFAIIIDQTIPLLYLAHFTFILPCILYVVATTTVIIAFYDTNAAVLQQ